MYSEKEVDNKKETGLRIFENHSLILRMEHHLIFVSTHFLTSIGSRESLNVCASQEVAFARISHQISRRSRNGGSGYFESTESFSYVCLDSPANITLY